MKFDCHYCEKSVEEPVAWPMYEKRTEGHYFAVCKMCSMKAMSGIMAIAQNPAHAKELIKHHFEDLKRQMVEDKVEYLEAAHGGIIYVGDSLGTVDAGNEYNRAPIRIPVSGTETQSRTP